MATESASPDIIVLDVATVRASGKSEPPAAGAATGAGVAGAAPYGSGGRSVDWRGPVRERASRRRPRYGRGRRGRRYGRGRRREGHGVEAAVQAGDLGGLMP